MITSVIVAVVLREKEKLKEREEAWLKIDELARKNPNVSKLYHQIIKDKYINYEVGSCYLFSCSLQTKPSNYNLPYGGCGVPFVAMQVDEAFVNLVRT